MPCDNTGGKHWCYVQKQPKQDTWVRTRQQRVSVCLCGRVFDRVGAAGHINAIEKFGVACCAKERREGITVYTKKHEKHEALLNMWSTFLS